MKFSQKIGKASIRNAIQIESIDTELENRLWNTIFKDFFGKLRGMPSNEAKVYLNEVSFFIWTDFFTNLVDEIPSNSRNKNVAYIPGIQNYIKEWFFKSDWYHKYDFLEFLSKIELRGFDIGFTMKCNNALKKEMSGYRLIGGEVVQITSEEEIIEVEDALSNSSQWEHVNIHLKKAISHFSNREEPDFRNSIKESISAVESLCVIITEDKGTTLGKALSKIEKKYKMHKALKSAFSSLYGYTSDAGGIRHALLENDIIVTMEDARFMLISCSAFINYLKVKIDCDSVL